MEKENKVNSFLEGSILISLLKFSIPILLALFLQALYGAADMWAVGVFCGSGDISAVATGSQTLLIATSLITGLSMGSTILLGQKMGQKDYNGASKVLASSIYIFTALSVILAFILITLAPSIARTMNAPDIAFDKTVCYIRICGAGVIFITAYNFLSSIYRGMGDSRSPFIFVLVACIVNIIGDVVLIKFFHLGTKGAAISTISAQGLSVVLALIMIAVKGLPFKFGLKDIVFNKKYAKRVLKVGAPVAFQDTCSEFSYLILMGLVNTLGVNASAGVGIAEKLVMFIVLIPRSQIYAVSAFSAQNIGAGNEKRAVRSILMALITSLGLGGFIAFISFFYGKELSSFFTADTLVMENAAMFLKGTSIECFVFSISACFIGYFNGLGKTMFVMLEGLISTFLIRIPYAIYATKKPDPRLFDIALSAVYAAVFILIASLIYFVITYKKRKHLIKSDIFI